MVYSAVVSTETGNAPADADTQTDMDAKFASSMGGSLLTSNSASNVQFGGIVLEDTDWVGTHDLIIRTTMGTESGGTSD